jgi:drug/metabolite transporter (DMT)-like permease
MKKGVRVFSGDEVGALRVFIAFLALSPLMFKHVNKDLLKHWKAFLGMGMFGSLIPGFLFAFAQKGISSSLTSMINALTPLFTLLITLIFFKEKIRMTNAVGLLIGLAGTIGLLVVNNGNNANKDLSFVLFAILATICNGITANIIKNYLGAVNSIACTVWGMLFVGPISGIYLFLNTDFVHKLNTAPLAWESFGYVCLLGVLGTSLSIILFNILIKNTSSIFGTSVTYLIPLVAIMWGVLDGESVLPMHIVCAFIILMGVYLVNKKPSLKEAATIDEIIVP